jgi:hypothetical protein
MKPLTAPTVLTTAIFCIVLFKIPDKKKKEQKYQKLHVRIAEKMGDSA